MLAYVLFCCAAFSVHVYDCPTPRSCKRFCHCRVVSLTRVQEVAPQDIAMQHAMYMKPYSRARNQRAMQAVRQPDMACVARIPRMRRRGFLALGEKTSESPIGRPVARIAAPVAPRASPEPRGRGSEVFSPSEQTTTSEPPIVRPVGRIKTHIAPRASPEPQGRGSEVSSPSE